MNVQTKSQPANLSQASFIYNNFSFFRSLSDSGRNIFLQRVKKFIDKKHWDFFFDAGRQQFLLKTLVAASCIEVTWGIKDKFISSYKYIAVYPDAIRLRENDGIGKALWLSGNINIPWNMIKEGFVVPDDKRIGLYEWTRALIVIAKKNNILDDFFSAYYKAWCASAMNVNYETYVDENLPLDEFGRRLTVVVKQFFDQPAELKAKYPELYEHTKRLLNIDLLEGKEYDYVYSEKVRTEKKIRSRNRALIFGVQKDVRNYGISSGIMYGILIQIPVVIIIWVIMGRKTYASWTFYGVYSTLCLLGVGFIYWFYYLKRGLSKKSSIILGSLGMLPCIYTILICLNYSVTIKRNVHHIHVKDVWSLKEHIPWSLFNNLRFTKLTLNRTDRETGAVDIQSYSSGSDFVHYLRQLNSNDEVELHTRTGLLGSEVYKSFEVTMYFR